MTLPATDATVAAGRGVEDLLGPASVLTRAEDAVRTRRGAEVAELLACGDWADLHAADPREDPGHVATPGGEELVRLGGEGTPMVRDLPLLELGIALGGRAETAAPIRTTSWPPSTGGPRDDRRPRGPAPPVAPDLHPRAGR